MNEQEWSGLERRTTDALGNFKSMLCEHTKDEMERYDQILNNVLVNNEASEARHDETQERISHLTQSIESFMSGSDEFMGSIRRAFPKDEDGLPDYAGHCGAHLSWISDAKASKELKLYIQRVVLGAAAIAVSSWIVLLIWQGVLNGPVK